MKRDRDRGKESAAPVASTNKSKKLEEEEQMWRQQANSGMDELFAVLGYKVKSSDMANVAQKLQQLEMVMMGLTTTEDGVSVLNDTVHYNPSDLSGWVESMLSELNNSNSSIISGESSSNISHDDDLRAIPGGAVFGNNQKDVLYDEKDNNNNNKRIKSASGSEFADNVSLVEPSRSVVLVDSQETGVRLVHTLMACAEAVQQGNFKLAEALVKHVGLLTVSQVGAMKKVAICFAEALARKIYKIYPQESFSYSDVLQMHFYETGPYLKFAHFTANQAILEAFAGANRVHVIDFSLKQGMQWPALMQALALRPGGPPEFRLTGIGPPQPDNKDDALQQVQGRTQGVRPMTCSNPESELELVGWKLAQLAKTIGVEFEFRGFVVNSLADLDAKLLHIKPSNVEAVAVNSVFELHRLLARPNAIENVLDSIKSMNPKIITIVEQEADHNGNVFLDRFNDALHYYSTMFDSLESSSSIDLNSQDLAMTEVYLGRQICNVVACEGPERVERHETLAQWRVRLGSAGFDAVHLGSNAFKQASMLLALFAVGDGYRVEENNGCLMLGWHNRPLIATSAWRIKAE